jgi:primosomal replication protein N
MGSVATNPTPAHALGSAGGHRNRSWRLQGGVRAISYGGELVAVATRERVFLAPAVDQLPAGHPKLRFVAVMCLFSRDIDEGKVPGPYCDAGAELYARCVLIADEEFEAHASEPDDELARRFGVPVEQIAAKREDVRASPCDDEGASGRATGPIRGEGGGRNEAIGSINRIVLTGGLARDPELREAPSGTPVATLRLAFTTLRRVDGGWHERPNYIDVEVWGRQAENAAAHLSKGRQIAIDGRLEWTE